MSQMTQAVGGVALRRWGMRRSQRGGRRGGSPRAGAGHRSAGAEIRPERPPLETEAEGHCRPPPRPPSLTGRRLQRPSVSSSVALSHSPQSLRPHTAPVAARPLSRQSESATQHRSASVHRRSDYPALPLAPTPSIITPASAWWQAPWTRRVEPPLCTPAFHLYFCSSLQLSPPSSPGVKVPISIFASSPAESPLARQSSREVQPSRRPLRFDLWGMCSRRGGKRGTRGRASRLERSATEAGQRLSRAPFTRRALTARECWRLPLPSPCPAPCGSLGGCSGGTASGGAG